jgi:hypothetical protein
MIKVTEIIDLRGDSQDVLADQTLIKNILVRVNPKEDVITLDGKKVIFPPDEVRWLREVKKDLFNILVGVMND